jgi:type IV pilus assembly protein PilB
MEAARMSTPTLDARLRIGALFLRDGLITPEQLEEALIEKELTGARLGEIFLKHKWVSETNLAHALAEQHGCEYLDLEASPPEPDAAGLLPSVYARRFRAIPVRFLGEDTVLVTVADPTDVLSSDQVRMTLGLNVRLAVSEGSAIERSVRDLEARWGGAPETDTDYEDGDEDATIAGPSARRIEVNDDGNQAPAIMVVNTILSQAIAQGASDVHFEPQRNGMVVRARVDGVMRRVRFIPERLHASVISRLKIMGELDIADRRAPQDGRMWIEFAGEARDLRVAVLPTTYGEQIVLRILQRTSGTIDVAALGMGDDTAAQFQRAVNQPYGAIIACGPTGSGKTTTLYAALSLLNTEERALMTIEDPVEFRIPGINQIEVNDKAGLTFARGLRTLLRSDPDVLLVGEVRDEETARIAIQAAMTGHLVLTSLHTHNAAASIERLKDMGVAPSLLASAVNCIIAQRLARRLCVHCREPYDADSETLHEFGLEESLPAGTVLYRPRGCQRCSESGYRGRAALYELLPVRGRIRRLIEASTEEIFAAAVQDGMRTLRQDGLRLCLSGVSSLEEIRRVTGDRMQ